MGQRSSPQGHQRRRRSSGSSRAQPPRPLWRRPSVLVATAVALLASLWMVAPAGAQDADPLEAVTLLGTQVNLLWVVIGAVLVVFMQAGFALVETGFCRAKHAAHVVSTNFAIFGLGFVGFFFIGFPLAFGGFSTPLIGLDTPVGDSLIGSGNWVFLWKGGWALSGGGITPALLGFFLYMVAFMDTVATIPTGSMAERWKWNSFVGWGLFCGALYYPLFAAWTWGGGWLAKTWDTMGLGAGYVDFAGSGVVHAVGGVAALAGASCSGPRIGKFAKDGTPRALPGHHIPMALLGTFILLFGWFGFNAASTLAATDVQFATVATNTAIAGGVRRHRRHVLDHDADRQARPRHDGQRHAGRPGGHHRAVRVRGAVGRGGHRLHRPDPLTIEAVFIDRAHAQDRRPGRRHQRPLRERPLRRAGRRHLRQRQLRRRLERLRQRGRRGHHQGRLGPVRRPGARCAGARDRHLRHRLRPSSRSRTSSPRAASGPPRRTSSAGLDLPEMGVLAYPDFQVSSAGPGASPSSPARRCRQEPVTH